MKKKIIAILLCSTIGSYASGTSLANSELEKASSTRQEYEKSFGKLLNTQGQQNPINNLVVNDCDLPAPANVAVLHTDMISTRVQWTAVPGATLRGYSIRYKKTSETTWKNAVSFSPQATFTFITALDPDTNYEVQVAAYCSNEMPGNYSPSVNFKTQVAGQCSAPENINSSNITGNSANITWQQISSASQYTIRYKKADETNWTERVVYGPNAQLVGLNTDTNYEVQVASRCYSGNLSEFSPSATFKTQATSACNAPTNISSSNMTGNSANITWQQVSGASQYTIRYKIAGETNWTERIAYGPNTQIAGLNSDTNYEVQVASRCYSGNLSEFSPSATFKTQATSACNAPTNISSSNMTGNSANITWQQVNGASQYTIRYKKAGETNWTERIAYGPNTQIADLISDTNYELQVAAKCFSGNLSEYSPAITFKTQATVACIAPTNISSSDITGNSANITWQQVNGASQYTIRYKKAGETNWTERIAYGPNTQIADLISDTNYELQVASKCFSGNLSEYSPAITFKTQATVACIAPTNISSSDITENSVNISWQQVTGLGQYIIMYRKVGEANWIGAGASGENTQIVGLYPDTNYELKIASQCFPNLSEYSPSITFKTQVAPVCNVPTGLTSTINPLANVADLTWTEVPGVREYIIRYRKIGDANWTEDDALYGRSGIGDLSSDTEYEVQVAAKCAYGVSEFSASSNFRSVVIPTVCNPPAEVNINNIKFDRALLSWSYNEDLDYKHIIRHRKVGDTRWGEYEAPYKSSESDFFGLDSDTEYEIQIATKCIGGRTSDFTPVKKFKTLNYASRMSNNIPAAIQLHPNPAIDILNVTNASDNATYKIYNASGLEMSAGKINDKKINVSHLLQGSYIIMIEEGQNIFRTQFIKK